MARVVAVRVRPLVPPPILRASKALQSALIKLKKTFRVHNRVQFLENAAIAFEPANAKGRSIDNIAIEKFFRTLKYSCIYISNFTTIKELKDGIDDYMYKYNFKRFHSSIDYQKPMNVYLEYVKSVA